VFVINDQDEMIFVHLGYRPFGQAADELVDVWVIAFPDRFRVAFVDDFSFVKHSDCIGVFKNIYVVGDDDSCCVLFDVSFFDEFVDSSDCYRIESGCRLVVDKNFWL